MHGEPFEEADLMPKTVVPAAVECFGTDSPAVLHGQKAKGHFPRADYTLPSRLHAKEVWFAGTIRAWRSKYLSLLAADTEIKEMMRDPERIKEANSRRHEHMKAASQYAEARGRELLELATAEHREDGTDTSAA